MDGEVLIGCTLVWDTSREVRMFRAYTWCCYEWGGS